MDCENNGYVLAIECGNYYFELNDVTIENFNGYEDHVGGATRGGGLWIKSTQTQFI